MRCHVCLPEEKRTIVAQRRGMWRWGLLNAVLMFNGVYDLCCGLAILLDADHPGANLHAMVFLPRYRPAPGSLKQRLLAYWLLTYAGPRLLAGIHGFLRGAPDATLDLLCAHTYLIEGIAYHAENTRFGTTKTCRAVFVAWLSYTLGMIVATRTWLP